MFIDHYGAGLAGKKAAPGVSAGTLFFAAQFLDLIWPVFILTGIEKVKIVPGLTDANPLEFSYYPYSHSLFMVIIWAALFGSIYFLYKRNLYNAFILGILVISHWVLDLIVHIPDLPIFPWSDFKVGIGLWNSEVVSVILEILIFSAGIYFYLSCTKAKNKKGTFGFWSLIIFLFIVYLMNIFSPPPPSVEAIGYAGLLQWLFIPWAYWIDRNRITISAKADKTILNRAS